MMAEEEHYFPRPQGVWQNKTAKPAEEAQPPSADSGHCVSCHAPLSRDDVGLHRKLVNRGAKTFLCKRCLAERFHMTLADCDTLIAHFREDGCSMFL